MKRFFKNSILLAAIVGVFSVTSSVAQTYEDAILAFNEGTELVNNNNHTGAIAAFERVITLSDQIGEEAADIKTRAQNQIPQLYFLIARDLYTSGSFLPAAEAFLAAAEQATKYGNEQIATRSQQAVPQIFLQQGTLYLRNENYESALEMFDEAIKYRPTYAAAYYNKGLVHRQSNDLEQALEFYDKAIQIGASSNERNVVENATNAARNFLLLRGVNQMEDRRYRPATELLRQALQYDDESSDVHYRLSEVYNKQALWDNAIASANRALELEQGGRTDRAKIYFELGYALKNKGGRDAAACDAFSNAVFGPFRAAAEHEIEHELKCSNLNRR